MLRHIVPETVNTPDLLLQVADVIECPLNGLRDRWWSWQMSTTGHKSILIGTIIDTVPNTIISYVFIEALGTKSFAIGFTVLKASRFGNLGILLGQVTVVVSVVVVLLNLFLDAVESGSTSR